MAVTKKAVKHASAGKGGGVIENVKTIVYAVLIAVAVRTIAFEPFNIPSGSMIPTLLVGDYLFVAKYAYGYSHFSLPFSPDLFSGRILGSLPARGDVVVFKYPRNTDEDYIKRAIGLPGDRVQMRGGRLYLNGAEVSEAPAGNMVSDDDGVPVEVSRYYETLPGGVKHYILKETDQGEMNNTPEYVVPDGHIFFMGDNRDNSADSRVMNGVGFVPAENLVGRAEFLFFSIHATSPWWEVWEWPFEIRWGRLFTGIR